MGEPGVLAVIFTNTRTTVDSDGYDGTAARMVELAAESDGFLGIDSVRSADGAGITVSYWRDEEAVAAWRADLEHTAARGAGRERWYEAYTVTVARVERSYAWSSAESMAVLTNSVSSGPALDGDPQSKGG